MRGVYILLAQDLITAHFNVDSVHADEESASRVARALYPSGGWLIIYKEVLGNGKPEEYR